MRRIILLSMVVVLSMCTATIADDVYTDNMIILMDCSGSMGGNKIVQAKNALKEVLKYIPKTTHVGLLSFGGQAGWQYPLGPRSDSELITAINRLKTGGKTPLGEYMKMAADRLLKQKEKQFSYGTYRLLIITDGEATDKRLVESYTPDIMTRGITIDTIGVFMNSQHSLAKVVHSYREANNTASLTKAISEVLAELDSKQDDAAATQEVFDDINSLPDVFVNEAIKALSSSPVTPIEGKQIIQPQVPVNRTTTTQQSKKDDDNTFADEFVIGGVILFIVLTKLFSRK